MSESQFNYLFSLKKAHWSSNSYNFWMQLNIAMKYAGYVVWILFCKCCKFGEKKYYNSRDIEFFLGDYFFGAPCIFTFLLRHWCRHLVIVCSDTPGWNRSTKLLPQNQLNRHSPGDSSIHRNRGWAKLTDTKIQIDFSHWLPGTCKNAPCITQTNYRNVIEITTAEFYLPVHHIHQSLATQDDSHHLLTSSASQTADSNECWVLTSRCHQRCPTV